MKLDILAIIKEAECIGCTKCIDACPVDAILGSNKHMHTVIAAECIGCQLCLPPCPVDCIDLIEVKPSKSREAKKQLALLRVKARKQRFAQHQAKENKNIFPDQANKKNYIQAILARKQNLK